MPRAVKPKAGNAVVKKPAARKKNGYAMPEPIPLGEVLTDMSKKQWKIGPSIGCGGFGEIYSACRADNPKKLVGDYDHVVKIEPHGNGPLFVEMHFYMRNAKEEDIKTFSRKKAIQTLGMPHFVGNGSHELNGQKHRFLVMPRFGKDVWSFFLANDKKLPLHTIYRLALQMLDVYEYIHGCTYVHGDLKGANILLGLGKTNSSQAYLVDYGLASHYTTKEFKADPKKMHNGTIEYTSRDAHNGVPTMRGDMEILGYNLIHWSGIMLPWEKEKLLATPGKVQKSKEDFMSDLANNLKKLYGANIPGPIKTFMQYIFTMSYDTTPNYSKCRDMFIDGLKSLGKTNKGELEMKMIKSPISKKTKQDVEDIDSGSDDEDDDFTSPKAAKMPRMKRISSPAKNSPIKKSKPSPKTKASPKKPTTVNPDFKLRISPKIANDNKDSPMAGATSSKRHGKTIINDNLTPNAKSNKTYEFNFELDVSMDANVIVNINRKKKRKTENDDGSSPEDGIIQAKFNPRVNIRKLNKDSSPKVTAKRVNK